MKKLFGTDGVRGVANLDLTPELAFSLGRVGSYILTKDLDSNNNYIIIGRDTRQSGDMLASAISAGICSLGVDVWDIGVAPTPVVAWLVKKFGALSGVVISASHNPAQDNGIKFFNHHGHKLEDSIEEEIEELMDSGSSEIPRAGGSEVGRIYDKSDIVTSYVDYLEHLIKLPENKLKVAIDAANGANYKLASLAYENFGLNFNLINSHPDGKNINYKCGSTNLGPLKELVIKKKLDLGIAFDGDADRLLAVDEEGREVDGDEIVFICSKYLPQLKDNKTVVATVMSNLGFEKAIIDSGKNFIRANVGDRYVLEKIKTSGAKIGGEQSGHIIFPNYNTTGDGLLTSLLLINAILISGKSLKELKDELELFPQVLVNVKVANKNIEDNKKVQDSINIAIEELQGQGRILVRPSGTEPKVRVMVEGKDPEVIEKIAHDIARVIEKEMSLVKA